MKNIGLLLLLSSAALALPTPKRKFETSAGPSPRLAYGVLVGWKTGADPKAVEKRAQSLGLKVASRSPRYRVFHFASAAKNISVVKAVGWCAELRRLPAVESCGPNLPLQPLRTHAEQESDGEKTTSRPVGAAEYCPGILGDEDSLPNETLDKNLTTFWAQYQIGSDLAKQALADVKDVKPTPVGIFDSGFQPKNLVGQMSPELDARIKSNPKSFADPRPLGNQPYFTADALDTFHGDQVANLVNSARANAPFGVGHLSELVQLVPALYESDFAKFPVEGMKLANFSLGWGDSAERSDGKDNTSEHGKLALKVFAELRKNKTILVKASGNEYPNPIEKVGIESGAILVGSSTPAGLPSAFSSEGPEVTILAPSDHSIQSAVKSGKPKSFGGTSGASPLVTGSLAAPVALLEGLNSDEAKTLLRLSATPNPSVASGQNGAGILNQYRMVRAALKLRNHWPANREKLSDPSTYDFSTEAQEKKNKAQELMALSDCPSQTKGFAMLRESFFLDPKRETAELIATVYEKSKKTGNAEFFRNIGQREADWRKGLEAKLTRTDEKEKAAALRAVARTLKRNESKSLLEKVAATDEKLRHQALTTLAMQGDLDSIRPYLNSEDSEARLDALSAVAQLRPLPPVAELIKAMESKVPQEAIGAMVASKRLGYRSEPVFDAFLKTWNQYPEAERADLAKNAVRGSWVLGDKRDDFLEKFAKRDPKSVAENLDEIPETHPISTSRLLYAFNSVTDQKERKGLLWPFSAFLRNHHLTAEQTSELLTAIRKESQEGRGSTALYELTKNLKGPGADLLEDLYQHGSAAERGSILEAVAFSAQESTSPFADLLKKISNSPDVDFARAPVAARVLSERDPESGLRLIGHPSTEVRAAVIEGLRNSPQADENANYRNFLLESAKNDDTLLSKNALYSLAKIADPSVWNQASKMYGDIRSNEERRRSFIYGAANLPERWHDLFAKTLDHPQDTQMVLGAILFKAKRDDETHSQRLKAMFRGEGEWQTLRPQVYDAFFSSKENQENYSRINGKADLELAQEWKRRGYPPLSPYLLGEWEYSRDREARKIVADAPAGGSKP